MRLPRLLLAAHGTRSEAGSATTAELAAAVRAARPGLQVDLCFLDVAEPTLGDELLAGGPTVLVPILLSTGHHVQADIPHAVAGLDDVVVARHLGPHPLLVDALLDRLQQARAAAGATGSRTVLVGAGSSRAEASEELTRTAQLLGERLGRDVAVYTMVDDLTALGDDVEVATYLLAEGQFSQTLAAAGVTVLAAVLGAHPAIVALVLQRFDETAGSPAAFR